MSVPEPVYAHSESEDDDEDLEASLEEDNPEVDTKPEVDDEDLEAAYDGRSDLKRRRRDPETGEVLTDTPAPLAHSAPARPDAHPPVSRSITALVAQEPRRVSFQTQAAEVQQTTQASPQLSEQLAAALTRIATHIGGKPDKFLKASPLLRQLLDGGQLQRCHRSGVIAAAKAAFADLSKVCG